MPSSLGGISSRNLVTRLIVIKKSFYRGPFNSATYLHRRRSLLYERKYTERTNSFLCVILLFCSTYVPFIHLSLSLSFYPSHALIPLILPFANLRLQSKQYRHIGHSPPSDMNQTSPQPFPALIRGVLSREFLSNLRGCRRQYNKIVHTHENAFLLHLGILLDGCLLF